MCLFVGKGKKEIFKSPREQNAALEIALSPQEGSIAGGEITGFIRGIVSVINSKLGGRQGCSVWLIGALPTLRRKIHFQPHQSLLQKKNCSLKMPLPGTLAARQ